jgi:hypothetical protein
MSRGRVSFGFRWLGIVLALGLPRVARGEDAADMATARTLGVEGVKLAIAGHCAEAIDKLSRSEALHHSVVVLEHLGECQVATGKVVDGSESLRRVLREPVSPTTSPALLASRDQASRMLDAATRRIARLTITVTGPTVGALWVRLDGAPVPAASVNSERAVDPGDHVVEAGATGFISATKRVHSNDGASDSVTLALAEEPALPASTVVVPHTEPPVLAPAVTVNAGDSTPRRSHVLAYAIGGVGLAAVVVGAVSGGVALADKSDLSSACHNGLCPSSSQSTLNGGETAGTVSTIGFVVGAVGVAAGITLYFVDLGSGDKETRAALRTYVGLGTAGVAGAF